jgi:hypothetical protein
VHVVVVSEDLEWFAHVHPEDFDHNEAYHTDAPTDAPADFVLPLRLPRAGRYESRSGHPPSHGSHRRRCKRAQRAPASSRHLKRYQLRHTPSSDTTAVSSSSWTPGRYLVALNYVVNTDELDIEIPEEAPHSHERGGAFVSLSVDTQVGGVIASKIKRNFNRVSMGRLLTSARTLTLATASGDAAAVCVAHRRLTLGVRR